MDTSYVVAIFEMGNIVIESRPGLYLAFLKYPTNEKMPVGEYIKNIFKPSTFVNDLVDLKNLKYDCINLDHWLTSLEKHDNRMISLHGNTIPKRKIINQIVNGSYQPNGMNASGSTSTTSTSTTTNSIIDEDDGPTYRYVWLLSRESTESQAKRSTAMINQLALVINAFLFIKKVGLPDDPDDVTYFPRLILEIISSFRFSIDERFQMNIFMKCSNLNDVVVGASLERISRRKPDYIQLRQHLKVKKMKMVILMAPKDLVGDGNLSMMVDFGQNRVYYATMKEDWKTAKWELEISDLDEFEAFQVKIEDTFDSYLQLVAQLSVIGKRTSKMRFKKPEVDIFRAALDIPIKKSNLNYIYSIFPTIQQVRAIEGVRANTYMPRNERINNESDETESDDKDEDEFDNGKDEWESDPSQEDFDHFGFDKEIQDWENELDEFPACKEIRDFDNNGENFTCISTGIDRLIRGLTFFKQLNTTSSKKKCQVVTLHPQYDFIKKVHTPTYILETLNRIRACWESSQLLYPAIIDQDSEKDFTMSVARSELFVDNVHRHIMPYSRYFSNIESIVGAGRSGSYDTTRNLTMSVKDCINSALSFCKVSQEVRDQFSAAISEASATFHNESFVGKAITNATKEIRTLKIQGEAFYHQAKDYDPKIDYETVQKDQNDKNSNNIPTFQRHERPKCIKCKHHMNQRLSPYCSEKCILDHNKDPEDYMQRFHEPLSTSARFHVANVFAKYMDTSLSTLIHQTGPLMEIDPKRFKLENLPQPLLNFDFKSAEVFHAVICSFSHETNLGGMKPPLEQGNRIFEYRSTRVGWIWVTKLIGKEINLQSRINARDVIRNRLMNVPIKESDLHRNRLERDEQLYGTKTQPFDINALRHPDLLIKRFHQANNVEWMLRNGYIYLLRDRLRMFIKRQKEKEEDEDRNEESRAYYRLDMEGLWYRYITPTNLDILSDRDIKRLVQLAIYNLDDEISLATRMKGITRSGNVRLFQIALANIKPSAYQYFLRDILQDSCEVGSIQIHEEILRYDKKPVTKAELYAYLYYSLYNRQKDMVRYLLEKYGRPNTAYTSSSSLYDCLYHLLETNDPEMYNLLVIEKRIVFDTTISQYLDYYASTLQNITTVTKQHVEMLQLVKTLRHGLPRNLDYISDTLIQIVKENPLHSIAFNDGHKFDQITRILESLELIMMNIGMEPSKLLCQAFDKALNSIQKTFKSVIITEYMYNHVCPMINNGPMLLFDATCKSGDLSSVKWIYQKLVDDQIHIQFNQVTHSEEVFKFLETKFDFTTKYLTRMLEEAIEINDFGLVYQVLYHHIDKLQILPKHIFVNALCTCNLEIVSYLLETYHLQVECFVFDDRDLFKIFENSRVVYFFVKHFKKLASWMIDMNGFFRFKVEDIVSLAIYYNRMDIVQYFQPQTICGGLEQYLGTSEEMLTLVFGRLPHHQQLKDRAWMDLGRIGSIKLLERVLSQFPRQTIQTKFSDIFYGAYSHGNANVINYLEEKYNLHYNERIYKKNIKILLSNNQFHLFKTNDLVRTYVESCQLKISSFSDQVLITIKKY
ncbi:hypothetical protein DFA_05307 [Cavenderia fasciculata]|uniref:Uncharacterized protein n=1 Tax=Cavenderia fasciculata TaxID=261658 RepID=F4PNX2_CACFS|nr:uncharacterized protein DFA_05307 [Cavenderia fasciculata]EGG23175.1 hypothetical protein DFA_05307 [Cavenderia fasciculata]|eukprot:XP_004361026.1 hypothetical protein DFA_05307 [Cavenderia fasciculata]